MSLDEAQTHGVQMCTVIHEGRCCQPARTGTNDEDGNEEGTATPPLPLPLPLPSAPLPEGQAWPPPQPPTASGVGAHHTGDEPM